MLSGVDAEVILRALIDRGILTSEDIEAAVTEIEKERTTSGQATVGMEVKPEGASQNLEDRLSSLEKRLEKSKWIDRLRTKGDLRLRNEMKTKPQGEDNNRQRVRFRWGVAADVNKQTEVGFGLASGSNDSPTSTNQTLEQEFQSKSIWLNYAYAKFKANEWLNFIGGKFESPFFHTDMVWDSDVRFDGFAATAQKDLPVGSHWPKIKAFGAGGYFPIDDAPDGESDVSLTVVQPGLEVEFGGVAKAKTAVAYYEFHNLEGLPTSRLAESKSTNSTDSGRIRNDFRVFSPIVETTINEPLGLKVPLSVFYEYFQNAAAEDANTAWRAGLQVNEAGKKPGGWEFITQYSRLEKDVFLDSFPDGEFHSGGTNAQGWEFIINYVLMENLILGVDYYNTKAITGAETNEQILQSDINFKF
jgi:hypothetical protein